jgi:hypothetical protein
MTFYRMIIKTETVDKAGKVSIDREWIEHIPADQVERYRALAQDSAPLGATRTIRFVREV